MNIGFRCLYVWLTNYWNVDANLDNPLEYPIISPLKFLGRGPLAFANLFDWQITLKSLHIWIFSSLYMVCLLDKKTLSQCFLCRKSNKEIQQNTRLVKAWCDT